MRVGNEQGTGHELDLNPGNTIMSKPHGEQPTPRGHLPPRILTLNVEL